MIGKVVVVVPVTVPAQLSVVVGAIAIIAEQIPGRLAEDALKNTATKIIHRLPGEDDLRAVASTMNLDPEQENFLSTISVGKAAFSNDGFERATFVDVHDSSKKYQIADFLEDEQVKINMSYSFLYNNYTL